MHFNGDISLGNIIELGSLVVVILGASFKLSGRLDKLEGKVELMYRWFETVVLKIRHTEGD